MTLAGERLLEDGWVDVTRPIKIGMPHWPGDPELKISKIADMASGASCNVTQISMCVHTGTHIDAPVHYIPGGEGVEAAPLAALMGRGRVIQCEDPVSIKRAFLEQQEIREGERLLFKTSTPPRPGFHEDYVYIAHDAAQFLAQRRTQLVGIDMMSVGGFHDSMVETHVALLGGGVWIVENIDLSRLPAGRCEIICLPLNIPGSDGAPARVLVRSDL